MSKFGSAALGGVELAYAELTSALAAQTNTTYADTGLAIPDFTVGLRPVYVDLLVFAMQLSTSAIPVLAITDSSGVVQADQQAFIGVNFAKHQLRLEKRITAAGTYSGWKVMHKVNSGQSFTIGLPTTGGVAARVRVFEA